MSVEFVDTNILIYAHDRSAGDKQRQSADLIARLTTEDSGAVSLQVLAEFYAAATRKLPLTSEKAEDVIRDFGTWTVHRPTHADLLRAARLQRRYKTSWWDALIINSATESGCRILWSEELADRRQYGGLTVRNPFK